MKLKNLLYVVGLVLNAACAAPSANEDNDKDKKIEELEKKLKDTEDELKNKDDKIKSDHRKKIFYYNVNPESIVDEDGNNEDADFQSEKECVMEKNKLITATFNISDIDGKNPYNNEPDTTVPNHEITLTNGDKVSINITASGYYGIGGTNWPGKTLVQIKNKKIEVIIPKGNGGGERGTFKLTVEPKDGKQGSMFFSIRSTT